MTRQAKGLNRNTIDKYYTKDSVANECCTLFQQCIQVGPNDLIIEPSAGNGSFIKGIQSLTSHFRLYDIAPEHPEVVEQDYLFFKDGAALKNSFDRIHVIGNPPFGRQSSLAIKFIKISCEFCDSIAFILPKSFKKDSLRKAFPLDFHLLLETDLHATSFLVNGVEYDVPCVFQVWERRECSRAVRPVLEPRHFIFVKKSENPDISVRRVGVNAGAIDTVTRDKSAQSHYFIRFTNEQSVAENIIRLSSVTYDFNNTVGPKSISKQELIDKFNSVL